MMCRALPLAVLLLGVPLSFYVFTQTVRLFSVDRFTRSESHMPSASSAALDFSDLQFAVEAPALTQDRDSKHYPGLELKLNEPMNAISQRGSGSITVNVAKAQRVVRSAPLRSRMFARAHFKSVHDVLRVVCSFESHLLATPWTALVAIETQNRSFGQYFSEGAYFRPLEAFRGGGKEEEELAWLPSGTAFWPPAGFTLPEVNGFHRRRSFVCNVYVAASGSTEEKGDVRGFEPRFGEHLGQFQVPGSATESSEADAEMHFAWYDVLQKGSSQGQILLGVQFLADHALMTPAVSSSSTCGGCWTPGSAEELASGATTIGASWTLEALDPRIEVGPCRSLLTRVFCSRSEAGVTRQACLRSMITSTRFSARERRALVSSLTFVPVFEACYPRPADCLRPPNEPSCTFYANCLERWFPCTASPEGNYALNIGHRYCKRYGDSLHVLSRHGRRWLNRTMLCFQEGFVPHLLADSDLSAAPASWSSLDALVNERVRSNSSNALAQCTSLMGVGLELQSHCFAGRPYSVCELSLHDWRTIFGVADWPELFMLLRTPFLRQLLRACFSWLRE